MLAGAQLGITMASLGLGAVSEPLVAHALEGPFAGLGLPEAAAHITGRLGLSDPEAIAFARENGLEVAVRGLTGTAEGADNLEETAADAAESEPFVFTAPEACSSRTIASTIAASLASSISVSSSNDFPGTARLGKWSRYSATEVATTSSL